ncbi:UNVERIFIED_CONTAM: hypothetical protein K2H54_008783 [Gekko kuhli]
MPESRSLLELTTNWTSLGIMVTLLAWVAHRKKINYFSLPAIQDALPKETGEEKQKKRKRKQKKKKKKKKRQKKKKKQQKKQKQKKKQQK